MALGNKQKNKRKNKAKNKIKNKIPIEHTAFYPYLKNYLEAMAIRQYSVETLTRRDNSLRRFIAWCDERGLISPQDVSKSTMQSYQKHLHYCLQANGNTLSPVTQNAYLAGIKQFFKWLNQENHILYNPAADLIFAKTPATLPVVLSVEEVESVMMQPELHHVKGLRDRTILEMFYSTGVRRSELCHLKLGDLSLSRKTIHVRRGKGNKDRLLPVGERAIHWLARYINDARPGLLNTIDEPLLFLNDYGEGFRDTKLGDKVKRYLVQAGINAIGSCHLLRHAMATHMLENGADIRYLQAMLGHADINSTQIYTHVSIRKLQEIHAATHPAKLEGRAETSEQETEQDE